MASDLARRKDHFQKKNCPKRTFPSNFVKLVSKILLFIFGRKNGRLLLFVCLFVCLLFVGGGDTPLRPGSSSKTRFDTGAYRGVQGRTGASRDKSLKMT